MAKAWWRDSDYALFDQLTKERDEARDTIVALTTAMAEKDLEIATLACERDGARVKVERLTDERDELLVRVANQDAELHATREAYNEARAELTRERIGIRPIDEVRCDAYRRGAEAMRDECIGAACGFFMGTTGFCNGDEDELEAVLEALPIPEEP
jgi:chromosome segregation ATPase